MIFSTVEGYHQYCGGIFSTVEGYHQYCKGYSVLWRDTISTVDEIQYCEEIPSQDTISTLEGSSTAGDTVGNVEG